MATFELREMREFRLYFHGFLLGMQVERKRHTKKRKALRFLLKLGHDDQFVWKRSVGATDWKRKQEVEHKKNKKIEKQLQHWKNISMELST